VIGDGLAKSALFLCVGVLQHQRATVSEAKLRGTGRGAGRGPAVTGVTVALGALFLADLPPYVSAAGHGLLVDAAERAGLGWLEIVIAFSVVAASGAVLRAAGRIWLGWGEGGNPEPAAGTADDPGEGSGEESEDSEAPGEQPGRRRRVPLTMVLPPLALLAIGLAIGLGLGLTAGIEDHVAAAAAAFSDRAAYAAAVLRTGPVPATAGITVPPPSLTGAGGVLADAGQALAALCVAGIALDRRTAGLRRALAAALAAAALH